MRRECAGCGSQSRARRDDSRQKGLGVNYSNIKYFDIADGEGVRTALFVSGCRHACPGCFNESAWDFAAGSPFSPEVEDEILASLEPPFIDGLTLLGGEPMEPENQRALVSFLRRVRERFPGKSIWCFTGEVYENLLDDASPYRCEATDELLSLIDVLVDGPFLQDQHDITLRFRGSANQRVIDLAATRASGCIRLWEDDPQYATHVMR